MHLYRVLLRNNYKSKAVALKDAAPAKYPASVQQECRSSFEMPSAFFLKINSKKAQVFTCAVFMCTRFFESRATFHENKIRVSWVSAGINILHLQWFSFGAHHLLDARL